MTGQRMYVGRDLHVTAELADGVDLEGRARLRPGLIVDLVWPAGPSAGGRVRRARVWSWTVVRLGRDGPHYRGHCHWA
jgi:hypothetical protein